MPPPASIPYYQCCGRTPDLQCIKFLMSSKIHPRNSLEPMYVGTTDLYQNEAS
ncbi:hypothetical protein PISMIDRAFT_687908 [Pisolithus microcarpus 441]|uniref:Unplaced genomic scaffold scaffold_251, whole genome shotgun sequence n=1 Tax=Pisolithus microcarpus 441 TaxID=765257 RepID=A0A0C9XQI4_9AGAM|nr:hypothetical protein BKA83DRAFT_687908 [Pisolithus microcarpus]KIK14490.1 hypothetical protein PISMIDRAFT_687908 [Pisolithus microcarpus 441]